MLLANKVSLPRLGVAFSLHIWYMHSTWYIYKTHNDPLLLSRCQLLLVPVPLPPVM